MTPSDADFTIAELEGPSDYDGILAAPVPNVPHAVVTNLSTITPERAKPLIDRNYACITEAYTNVNASITAASMDNSAMHRGWAYTIPCFGLYEVNGVSYPLSFYAEWLSWPYGWCGYLAEHVL